MSRPFEKAATRNRLELDDWTAVDLKEDSPLSSPCATDSEMAPWRSRIAGIFFSISFRRSMKICTFSKFFTGSFSPLEIDIQPYCGWSPEEFLSHYEDESMQVEIRKASGYVRHYKYDWNYLTVWSENSAISMSTTRHADFDIEQAAQDLIPIAENTGATLEPLRPPTSAEC